MIAVDTNILVRYLLSERDEHAPDQEARAIALVEKARRKREPLVVPLTAAFELPFVLGGFYQWTRADVCDAFALLLRSGVFKFEREAELRAALTDWRDGPADDLADYLAVHLSISQGARKLVTFDRKLARHPHAGLP